MRVCVCVCVCESAREPRLISDPVTKRGRTVRRKWVTLTRRDSIIRAPRVIHSRPRFYRTCLNAAPYIKAGGSVSTAERRKNHLSTTERERERERGRGQKRIRPVQAEFLLIGRFLPGPVTNCPRCTVCEPTVPSLGPLKRTLEGEGERKRETVMDEGKSRTRHFSSRLSAADRDYTPLFREKS